MSFAQTTYHFTRIWMLIFTCIGNVIWLAPHDIGKCFKIYFYDTSELFIMTFELCVSPQII